VNLTTVELEVELFFVVATFVLDECANAPGDLATGDGLQRRTGWKWLFEQGVRRWVGGPHLERRANGDDSARNVPQDRRRSPLRLLERSSARGQIRGHLPERREHGTELQERTFCESGLSLARGNRERGTPQGFDWARQRTRCVAAQPERSERARGCDEEHEDAEVSALAVERELVGAGRRCDDDARCPTADSRRAIPDERWHATDILARTARDLIAIRDGQRNVLRQEPSERGDLIVERIAGRAQLAVGIQKERRAQALLFIVQPVESLGCGERSQRFTH
jgi:hypothetical protein